MSVQRMIDGWRNPFWPRAGKIHLGETVINAQGKEHPRDLPYFNCSECPEVVAVYGDRPTRLPVMVPSPNIGDWFPIQYKRYAGENRLICRGDGVTAIAFDEGSGGFREQQCPGKACEFYGTKCTEIGNLMVILYDVDMFSVYQIDTGSFYGSNQVYDSFEMVLNMVTMATRDPRNVCAIQFELVREEKTIPYTSVDRKTGAVTRQTQTKMILNLIAPRMNYGQLSAAYTARQAPARLGPATAPRMLIAPDDEMPGVAVDIDESQPTDLYPGAAPVAASLEQRAEWAELIEQAAEFGVDPAEMEAEIAGEYGGEAFGDLSEGQAAEAIESLKRGVAARLAASGTEQAPADTGGPADGQGAAWEALIGQVQEAGKNVPAVVKSVLKGAEFSSLTEEQAAAAIKSLSTMVQNWQGGVKPKAVRSASTKTTPKPAPATAQAADGNTSFGF